MDFKTAPLIHIGYPKALSSWMQKHLFIPANGFCIVLDPLTLQLSVINPTPFAFEPRQAEEWIAKRLNETPESEKLRPVITSEALVGHTHCGGYNAKSNADRLKKLCPDGRVLIVVREQRAMIRSLYTSYVVWGMPHTIERILDPVRPHQSPQFNLDFLRYDLLVDYYQKLYGRERVLVLAYEAFAANPSEFLRRVFSFCQIENSEAKIKKIPARRRVNSGQTLLNLMLGRWRNQIVESGLFNFSGMLKPTKKQQRRRAARSWKNRFPSYMDNWFEKDFKRKVAARCDGEFAASNRRLQELTGLSLGAFAYDL